MKLTLSSASRNRIGYSANQRPEGLETCDRYWAKLEQNVDMVKVSGCYDEAYSHDELSAQVVKAIAVIAAMSYRLLDFAANGTD